MHFRQKNHPLPNRKGDNALAGKNITQLDYLIGMLMDADIEVICGAEYGERQKPERMKLDRPVFSYSALPPNMTIRSV